MRINVGPEPEFFLLRPGPNGHGVQAVPHDVGGYFDFSARTMKRSAWSGTAIDGGAGSAMGHGSGEWATTRWRWASMRSISSFAERADAPADNVGDVEVHGQGGGRRPRI